MIENNPLSYIQPIAVRPRVSQPQPRGLPVINLGFNELPYPPSESVLAAIQSATTQANSYGNPTCEPLRNAIGDAYQLDPNRIICGNGSEELLDIIGRCFASTDDEIIISEYGYILFSIVANRVGAQLIKAKEQNFTTQIDSVLAAVTDKTRIVFIANPNNPTGTMISEAELLRLAQALPPQTVLVLDLAYGEFVSNSYNATIHNITSEFNNIIVTRTFSKAFGLAGLRVGWCYAPEWMIPILYAARGMGTVNAAAQAGAIAALDDRDTMLARVDSIVAEKKIVTESLTSMHFEVIPSSTNFLLVAPPSSNSDVADKLAAHLFEHAGFVVNQTREAGLERFIRFSVSLLQHNTNLLGSVQTFMENGQTKD